MKQQKYSKLKRLREVGNYGLIAGTVAVLYYNHSVGAIILAACEVMVIPYASRMKYWDVVCASAFCLVIDIGAIGRPLA